MRVSINSLINGLTADTPNQTTALTTEQLTYILSSKRRRITIRVLAARDGGTRLSDLADAVAAAEHGDYATSQRKAVYVALMQSHLPEMNDVGMVDYDKNRGTVYCESEVEPVAELLAYIEQATASSPDGDVDE